MNENNEKVVEVSEKENLYKTVATGDVVQTYTPCDPEWTDYVLSHLEKNEFNAGYPTVDGVRRLVNIFLGDIISSKSSVVSSPSDNNQFRATIIHELVIRRYRDGQQVVVNGVVDVYPGNAKSPFDKHVCSSCDTKAEGKALRRALQIKAVVAEEITELEQVEKQETVSTTQISVIDNLCKRNSINVENFVKTLFDVKTITTLNKEQATEVCRQLNIYQRSDKEIPQAILGYVADWQSTFK
jgi:hypothetical protein